MFKGGAQHDKISTKCELHQERDPDYFMLISVVLSGPQAQSSVLWIHFNNFKCVSWKCDWKKCLASFFGIKSCYFKVLFFHFNSLLSAHGEQE